MTREIKFRGLYDQAEGGFIYTDKYVPWVGTEDYGCFLSLQTGGFRINDDWHLDNADIMQYTGLKDKNGVEIYESDYLESESLITWCVYWGSGKYILQNISNGDIIDCNEENTRRQKIIGNKYQNPREHQAMASIL